jgi:hypothetical protein
VVRQERHLAVECPGGPPPYRTAGSADSVHHLALLDRDSSGERPAELDQNE